MTLPDDGPCEPWCTWAQVTACSFGVPLGDVAEEIQTWLIDRASELLFKLTDRNYPGLCTSTRAACAPCRCNRWPSTACCCSPHSEIVLGGLVSSIDSVVVDGVTLTPGTDYVLVDWRKLVRIGDGKFWPRCSDITDPDAFTITWKHGRAIPPGGQYAAAALVAQFAPECSGQVCVLPDGTTVVQREGLTITISEIQTLLEQGYLGVKSVDTWLMADRRGRIARPGMVDYGGHSPLHHVDNAPGTPGP